MVPHKFKNPVLFFSNGIGDHFINIPAIRALASIFQKRLILICENVIADSFIKHIEFLDLVYIESIFEENERVFDLSIIKNNIKNCDLFISLVPWNSTSLLDIIKYYKPSYTVGYFNNYNYFIERDYSIHSCDLAFKAVEAFKAELKITDFADPIKMPDYAIKEAEIIKNYLPNDKKIIAIHMETLEYKMWSLNKWNSFINQFLTIRDDFIAITLGYENGEKLDYGINADRIIPCNGLELPVSIHLLSLCDLFVGIDSSMLHAADFYRIPAIGLFGPTNYKEFGFRFNNTINYIIASSGNMNEITCEGVLKKSLFLLNSQPKLF